MDPFIISAVTFLTLVLGGWAGAVMLMIGRIMTLARRQGRKVRTDDKKTLIITGIILIASLVITFVWPGLIYMIPATVAFFEIASIPFLGFLSERAYHHWKRMKDPIDEEVDEHAII